LALGRRGRLPGYNVISDFTRLGSSRIGEIIAGLGGIYADIETAQAGWKAASPFHCAEGCGSCCVGFEPDVLECEALYLAYHLVASPDPGLRAVSDSLLAGTYVSPRSDPDAGCPFFDPANPYHCTVYGGRCLICRLFAYTGDRGKDGRPRWKPCKFLPLEGMDGGLDRRVQYGEDELIARFGEVPPIMSDFTARIVALDPDSAQRRRPLREALPVAIARVMMVLRFADSVDDPVNPDPEVPNPLAS